MIGRVTRDALALPLMRLNSQSALHHKFDKVWGKTSIPGAGIYDTPTEVYNSQLTFHQGGQYVVSDTMKRFVKALGMKWEEFISNPVDGDIERMYFKLNPTYVWDGSTRPGGTPETPDTKITGPTLEQIRDAINAKLTTGDEIEVSVSYGGESLRYLKEHSMGWDATGTDILAAPLNSPLIRSILHANPWHYFGNIRDDGYVEGTVQWQTIKEGNVDIPTDSSSTRNILSNAPICDVASTKSEWGVFALMKDLRTFEPIGDVYDEQLSTVSVNLEEGEVLKYSYKLKYKFTVVTTESKVVLETYARYQQVMLAQDRQDAATGAINTKVKSAMQGLAKSTVTNSLYYGGSLRVESVSKMKRADFADMLAKNFDTGYDVKEASFWEKALFVVIIIAAVVAGFFTGGATWAGVATGLAVGSAVLTVGMMLMIKLGGLSAGGLAGRLGMMAEYIGYASILAGIGAILQNAGQAAARAALAKQGVQNASQAQIMQEAAKYTIVDNIVQAVTQAINGAISNVTSMLSGDFISKMASMTATEVISAINTGLSMISKGYEMYDQNWGKSAELEDEYDEAKKAQEEYDKGNNSLKDPLAALWHVQDRVCMSDAITRLDRDMDNLTGLGTFNEWYAERASI